MPQKREAPESRDLICFTGFVLFSLSLSWLLFLAYPQTIVTAETTTYWGVGINFHWFAPNPGDWWRHVPYGAILVAVSNCSNPSAVIYWSNTILFAFNSGVIFLLGSGLFRSRLSGFILAACFVAFEFLSMRTFFLHLFATADPTFAELVFMGILLILTAWTYANRVLFVLAYGLLGVAIFMKPAGHSYFPIWICFAIFSKWLSPNPLPWKQGTIIASIIFLLTPHMLWSARNYCIYGYPNSVASGGFSLLQATLPLLNFGDKVLDDPKANREFIYITKESKRFNFDRLTWEGTPACVIRSYLYNQYFPYTEKPVSPFDYLAGITNPDVHKRLALYDDSARMFKLDKQSKDIALRIIRQHPLDYLNRVIFEYFAMFTPAETLPRYYESYHRDPTIVYQNDDPQWINIDDRLYPGRKHPDTSLVNTAVANALGLILLNKFTDWFLNIYYANQLWLSHLAFFGSVAFFIYAKSYGMQMAARDVTQRVAVVISALFLTACTYYTTVSLIQVAHRRYAIAGGDLELHLLFLIALVQVFRCLYNTALFQIFINRLKQRWIKR